VYDLVAQHGLHVKTVPLACCVAIELKYVSVYRNKVWPNHTHTHILTWLIVLCVPINNTDNLFQDQ